MLLVIDGSEAPMRRLGATKLGRRSYIGDSSPLHLVKMRVWAEMSGVQGTGLGRAGCDLALPGSAVRVALRIQDHSDEPATYASAGRGQAVGCECLVVSMAPPKSSKKGVWVCTMV